MDTVVKIDGIDYIFKRSYRGLMEFESKAKKNVTEMTDSFNDIILLCYCFLSACNRDTFKYSFDQFIDQVDADDSILMNLTASLNASKDVSETDNKKKVAGKETSA
jgi:hypothetical protein